MVSTNKFLLYILIFSSFIIFSAFQSDPDIPPEVDTSTVGFPIILLIICAVTLVAIILEFIYSNYFVNKTSHRSKNKNKIDRVIETKTVYETKTVVDPTEENRLKGVNKALENQLTKQKGKLRESNDAYKNIFNQLKEEIKIPIYNPKYGQLIDEKIKSKPAKLFTVLIPLKSLYTYFDSNKKADWFYKRDEESVIFQMGLYLFKLFETMDMDNDGIEECAQYVRSELDKHLRYTKIKLFKMNIRFDPDKHYSLSGPKQPREDVIPVGWAISNRDSDTIIKKAPVK